MAGTLTPIHLYPVKSCRAVALDRVEIASTGLRGDRLFQVVDGDGNPVTQRQEPMLATVRPSLTDGALRPRCAIPQVDQVDGSRHKEPAKVLKKHRWCTDAASVDEALRPLFEGNALFGIGCSAGPVGATIAVGDELSIHDSGSSIIPAPS